jgi:hypothetical protein
MTAVVAGNYKEYRCFIRENNLDTKNYFYVSCFEKILGYRKLKYILYGSYYEREDFNKIEEQLHIREFERLGQNLTAYNSH